MYRTHYGILIKWLMHKKVKKPGGRTLTVIHVHVT
jgi:hypothetical protein